MFFSLPLDAFQGLLTHSSLLAPFLDRGDRGGLARGLARGAHFGKKVRGSVFRFSYSKDLLNIVRFMVSVWVKGRVLSCLRNPQIGLWCLKSSGLNVAESVLACIYSLLIHSLNNYLLKTFSLPKYTRRKQWQP